jgi:hypothetical protein
VAGTTEPQPTPRNGQSLFTVTTDDPEPLPPGPTCPNDQWTPDIVDVAFIEATLTLLEDGAVSDTVTVPVSWLGRSTCRKARLRFRGEGLLARANATVEGTVAQAQEALRRCNHAAARQPVGRILATGGSVGGCGRAPDPRRSASS